MGGGQKREEEGDKAAGGGDYGTFQGPPSYPPPRPPPVGFPQPAPPPGLSSEPYARHRGAYQAIPAQDHEAGARGHGPDRLPCCGIGFGWFLVDYREKPGYVACTIAAVLATIAVIIGATAGAHIY
ncbi:hypothetical protein PR202_gb27294 [Eleusine coracana subsp. coracana]|uniref:Uncharacterized protein n=1 Tax=Eleusine coracana subsp. coracana TaxID=191504 RepID=A0AAV5FTD4_ELECO|nr:hypothetical protein PR202_gb27294 [Eleusine coracana subsp. coracana]